MFLRLTKNERDYILKSEREEYWDKRIQDMEQELAKLPADSDEIEDKQEELASIRKMAEKARTKLAKHGPTVFRIKSTSEVHIDNMMSKVKRTIGKFRGKGKDELTSEQLGYTRTMAREICRLGLVGWENLKDPDTGENIPFNAALIDELPYEITSELSNNISGSIDEEEALNLN